MLAATEKHSTVAIEKDRFGSIEFDPQRKILFMVWSGTRERMPQDTLKDNLIIFADSIVEQSIPTAIIDIRESSPPTNKAIEEWRKENIVPKQNAVLKKCAYLTKTNGHGLPGLGKPFRKDGEEFVQCWFADENVAMEWLMAS